MKPEIIREYAKTLYYNLNNFETWEEFERKLPFRPDWQTSLRIINKTLTLLIKEVELGSRIEVNEVWYASKRPDPIELR